MKKQVFAIIAFVSVVSIFNVMKGGMLRKRGDGSILGDLIKQAGLNGVCGMTKTRSGRVWKPPKVDVVKVVMMSSRL